MLESVAEKSMWTATSDAVSVSVSLLASYFYNTNSFMLAIIQILAHQILAHQILAHQTASK